MSHFATRVPAARFENLVMTEAEREVLVYDQSSHHMHHLNQTSATIWRLCDGQRTVADLTLETRAELGADVTDDMVVVAVAKLADANLLDGALASELRGSTQSRRSFMRKAAVAGAVAIPTIVSTTVPSRAGAPICPSPAECSAATLGVCCTLPGGGGIGICARANPAIPTSAIACRIG